MARYIKDFPTTKNPEEIMKIANDFFSKEGFNRVNFKGEDVWKKGVGFGRVFTRTICEPTLNGAY